MSDLFPKMTFKELLSGKTGYLAISLLLIVLLAGGRFGLFIMTPTGDGKVVKIVDFTRGSSVRKFAEELEKQGVIGSSTLFALYARISGVSAKMQAGTYQLSDAMTPPQILHKLVSGDVYEKKFAVPEGYSIFQIAEMLDSRGFFKKDEFLKACKDHALLKELGIKGESVEGYLHPSTYNLLKIDDPAELIRQMVAQFRKLYDEQLAPLEAASRLSRSQIITLASIVEKEAVAHEEKPLIASVFHNRLKKGMPLQSDPTAVYGIKVFGGKVSGADVRRDSAYNTYRINGLPPGPIGNPGTAAIEATLKPASTGYYYFVAKKDGTHYFSKDLDEHNRAVRLYLKGGAAQTGTPELKNDAPNITGRR